MEALWNRIRDWALLGLLLVISLGVMTGQNNRLLHSLRALSLTITAQVEGWFAGAGTYFRALEENTNLRATNIALSSELARLRSAEIENTNLRALLALTTDLPYETRTARIIQKDLTAQQNTFTIDRGSADGIALHMPVIDHRGVLGKVVLVAPNAAMVQPYLNTAARIAVKIQPTGAVGTLRWEGRTPELLKLDDVVRTIPVEKGQMLVTSGYAYSDDYPADLPIGVVDSVAQQRGKNFWDIYVRPLALLHDANYAVVLLHTPNVEIPRP